MNRANLDRSTHEHARNTPGPVVTGARFGKHDTCPLIDDHRAAQAISPA